MLRALLVFAPSLLCAQLTVTGRLLDPSDTPVAGVEVMIEQGQRVQTAITSEAGRFRFDNLAPGDYELVTTLLGFDPVRRQIRVGRQASRELVIRLRLAVLREELE